MDLEFLIIALIVCELFEFFWQKGDTLKEFMQILLEKYNRGVIFFISLHPTLFFILYCIFTLNISNPIIYTIAFLKFADIGFKILLLDKLQNNKPLGSHSILFKEDYNLSFKIKIAPLIMYVSSFFLALFY